MVAPPESTTDAGELDRSPRLHRAVIIAVVAVGMMQVAIHKVIGVVTVGTGFMPATGAMCVIFRVPVAGVFGRAYFRIMAGHSQSVLLDTRWRDVVQMAIVEVVSMVVVLQCSVAAVWAMVVVFVRMRHFDSLLWAKSW
jgi:hypothetical protein